MCENKPSGRAKIITKLAFTVAGLVIVNFFADYKYALENYIRDYSYLQLGYLLTYVPAMFVIIYFLPDVLSIKRLYRLAIKAILGLVFCIILYVHISHVEFPDNLDKFEFISAYASFFIMIFLTMGIASDTNLKEELEFKIDANNWSKNSGTTRNSLPDK
jgi:hypothetical protein